MKEVKAAFLDRDGTINVEKDYIKDPSEIELIDGSAKAIAKLNESGYMVFGVSNQSGIARGFMTVDDVHKTNSRVIELARSGGSEITEIFFCPHHKDGKVPEYSIGCECRKPGTDMISQAAKKYGLKFTDIVVIGDKICDVGMGKNIGATTALVATGYGERDRKKIEEASGSVNDSMPDHFAKDLAHAVELIL